MRKLEVVQWYRRSRRAFSKVVALGSVVVCATSAAEPKAQPMSGERVRPPSAIDCPRDRLTVFQGAVRRYVRKPGEVQLQLATDEETLENFNLRFPVSNGPGRSFLIRGRAFTAADWTQIESAPGRLLPDVRARVWVCRAARTVEMITDWLPPERPGGSQLQE